MAFLLISSCDAQELGKQVKHSAPIPNGAIPDERTAVAVAEAVLLPVYGPEKVYAERPFQAVLHDDVWIVTGSSHTSAPGSVHVGGTSLVEISKAKGCIERITHSK
jgi:hypothetical protein